MADEDTEIVKNLPAKFVSVSKPIGPAVIRMIERRKQAHEDLIFSLRKEIKRINEETDEEIKDKSEDMKTKLDDIKHDVKRYYGDIQFNLNDMDIEDFYSKNMEINLFNFNQKELEAVNDYCIFLRNNEKSRIQKFKDLIKEIKSKAIEIAHELPFTLDEFFEKEMMNINTITLSNYQHYIDIEKELKLQVENDLKLWYEESFEISEIMMNRIRSMMKRSTFLPEECFKEDSLGGELVVELGRFKSIKSLKSEYQYQIVEADNTSISSKDIEKWLKEIQKCLGALDQSAKNIVQLYKSTIIVLFHRHLGELKEIKKNISSGIIHSNEIDVNQLDIYSPTADQLNIHDFNDVQELQECWGNAIQEMTNTINTTYSFLKGSSNLWDRHFIRIKQLQILVLRDLENTLKKNAFSSTCFEGSLNIVLEELRQASNETELKKKFENVRDILDKMKEMFINDNKCEIEVLMKYKTMMETEIEVLVTELKRFLTIYPPDYEKDPKKQRRRASQMSMVEQGPSLPIQILYCVFQVGAVKNWMFGLWEAINNYVTVCKQEILAQVDFWIQQQTEIIDERLRMKLTFHDPRYDHVKCANYEKRLAELKLHGGILERHKNKVQERMVELNQCNFIYDKKCEGLCNTYTEECNSILEALPNTNNLCEAKNFNIVIKKKLDPIETEIKFLTDDIMDSCTEFFEKLKFSNLQFVSSARLFNEGGNFHMDELNELYKELKQLEDVTNLDIHLLTKEIDTTAWKNASRIQTSRANLAANLTKVINEHGHNERLAKKIKNMQTQLQTHVMELRKLFNNIEKKLQRFNDEAKKNLGNENYLPTFLPQFESFLKEVVEVCEYTYHPEPVEIFLLYSYRWSGSPKMLHKIAYVDQLFAEQPNPELTDFITAMLNILHNSFIDITTTAQDFYNADQNATHLLNETKLQPTYHDCMEEILLKYKFYLIQCEICWLENAVCLISILNNIKIFKEEFTSAYKTYFYGRCMEDFDLHIKKVMDQLKQDEQEFRDKLKQIHTRLKVLFGHPKNNEMLKQLQKDYQDIHADNQTRFGKILTLRKEYLDTVMEETKTEVEKLLGFSLVNDKIIDELKEKLMNQIAIKKGLLSIAVTEMQISYDKSVSEHIVNYLESSTNKLDSSNSQTKAAPSLATISSKKSYSDMNEFLNALEFTSNITKTKMDEFVEEKMTKALEDFKNDWDSEIKYILSLFKVKYDADIF